MWCVKFFLLTIIRFCLHSDDHGFSPLHWAAKEGHLNLVTLLIQRGARVNATNMGDDTPLHLATAHGHREIVGMVCITQQK
jgi:integrin-linked kinase